MYQHRILSLALYIVTPIFLNRLRNYLACQGGEVCFLVFSMRSLKTTLRLPPLCFLV